MLGEQGDIWCQYCNPAQPSSRERRRWCTCRPIPPPPPHTATQLGEAVRLWVPARGVAGRNGIWEHSTVMAASPWAMPPMALPLQLEEFSGARSGSCSHATPATLALLCSLRASGTGLRRGQAVGRLGWEGASILSSPKLSGRSIITSRADLPAPCCPSTAD